MHPGLAAAVLTASSNPSLSPSAHGGIQWGDVPAWVAAIATVLGLAAAATAAVIAYRQFRQQTDVLTEEIERRVREQAENVNVSWLPAGYGRVYNASRRPITNVVAGITDSLPDGGTNTHHAGQWRTYNPPTSRQEVVPLASAEVAVIRPNRGVECLFESNQLQGENRRLVVRFHDDAGHRWQLDEYMHLERAPEDGW